MKRIFSAAAAVLLAGCATLGDNTAMAQTPTVASDHAALLASDDPQLAANKRLVYDMYRIVLQAGLADRAHEFITEDYIQHNPNAAQGRAGLIDYVRSTRPERPIKDVLDMPLIHLMAEGDYVTTAFVRPEKDANGETYYSTWFDLYRIENGKVAEHWDPMLKTDARIDPNTKKL
ncbi:nuclear transport factor 2 family protein [Altericroceibacterium xinjiangense]|uniref:nuclear transport factor 2 family protein n=1 Tax=Altericroceibacterium xinjiangense TaxID=762261 RepID=UPI001F4971E8|nr:nuclear transport factor 2 family protein [Altericroceibacterium xinjiangense]